MTDRKFTTQSTEYVVVFDNKSTHHCRSLEHARRFAEAACEKGQYGRPVEIYKSTKVSVTTQKTVHEFGGE